MITATTRDAYQLFHDGQIALAQVEQNGLRVDVGYLTKTISEIDTAVKEGEARLRASKVYKQWQQAFGREANLTSLTQLGTLLFDHMKLPYTGERTETGRYKADEKTLSGVDLPFVRRYLKLGKLRRIRDTFLEGIRRELCDGYIHPSFNLASGEEDQGGGARSGRGSANSPNAQNFPRRNPELEKIVRRCFVPEPGHHWLENDFSGIEVKISCCYHHDPTLIKYVTDPTSDMHRDTGAELFKLPKEGVDRKTVRDASKNQFVFPQFYGSVWFQCAPPLWERMVKEQWKIPGTGKLVLDHLKDNGITQLGTCKGGEEPESDSFAYHVKAVEHSFWYDRFPDYTAWKDSTWEEYQRTGEVWYHTGFVARGYMRRNQVLNYATQGSAFHCLLQALIWIQQTLDRYRMRSKITSQIHDSINLSVDSKEKEDVLYLTKEIMTKRLAKHWPWLVVPLDIEAEMGDVDRSWFDKRLVSPITPERGDQVLVYDTSKDGGKGGWQWN